MQEKAKWQADDTKWMARALGLAELGKGKVYPNPMVGAVIVKDGLLLGEGYHKAYGGPHAEIEAFKSCGVNTTLGAITAHEAPTTLGAITAHDAPTTLGATLYVSLEPCCHYGKTPPCTEAIINAGISRVVIGAVDPNPLVAGKGIEQLRRAGIKVESGLLESDCHLLNQSFNHFIAFQRPYVILKAAMSLDGKIATRSGESKWITGEAARASGHRTRGQVKGILVGIGTVLADDPQLNCRLEDEEHTQPVRIVLDKRLEMPLTSKLVQTTNGTPLLVVTSAEQLITEKASELTQLGVKLIDVPLTNNHFNWSVLLKSLSGLGIDSLLIEGGGKVHDSALRAGAVDEVHVYIAPMIIGGNNAPNAVGGVGFNHLFEAVRLTEVNLTLCGQDWLYKAKVAPMSHNISRKAGD